MDVVFDTDTYILVIDTDTYAGNIERELAGYTTGVYDYEHSRGESEASDAEQANPEIVKGLRLKAKAVMHSEYGQVTNTIRATPGRFNNGMGFSYSAGEEDEARAKSIQSMKNYKEPEIAKCEARILNGDHSNGWTKEACERTIEAAKLAIEQAGKIIDYPSFESVAMFFSEALTDEEMAFVEQRAREYAEAPMGRSVPAPFTIRDVYMVKVSVKIVEERL